MTHESESSFEEVVVSWFENEYGEDAVETQVYQPEPYWFVDVVVDVEFGTLFIELESREDAVRAGVAQALGYCAADPVKGIPMVIAPKGHIEDTDIDRLRRSTTVVIREFDEEQFEFV